MSSPPADLDLTPRQQQILSLLQAGKVNKEIAAELQIGIGTVKQHVVALFKRMQVSNRAMAAARGGQLQAQAGTDLRQAQSYVGGDGILLQRPCVVLALALDEDCAPDLLRHLQACLSLLALEHGAVYLARQDSGGELVFGLNKASEYTLLEAVRLLQNVQQRMQKYLEQEGRSSAASRPSPPSVLRAAAVAGLVVASMERHGGWSGEVLAATHILRARNLLTRLQGGQVALSEEVRSLLLAFGIADGENLADCVNWTHINALRWRGERPTYPLQGRNAEWQTLLQACVHAMQHEGSSALINLCGETGMGKTLLCRQLASFSVQQQFPLHFWRCQPAMHGMGGMIDVLSAHALSWQDWLRQCKSLSGSALLIVDDVHLLDKERQKTLLEALAGQLGLTVLSGRRLQVAAPAAHKIQLQRLSAEAITVLLKQAMSQGTGTGKIGKRDLADLSKLAAGVPLFALELAQQMRRRAQHAAHVRGTHLPEPGLALAIVVCARLDELALDRHLLQAVAESEQGCTWQQLEQKMQRRAGPGARPWQQNLQIALAAGVVCQTRKAANGEGESGELLQISHPLMRQVLLWLAVNKHEPGRH